MTDPREILVRLSETLTEGLEFDLVATYLRTAGENFEKITGDEELLPRRLPGKVAEVEYPGEHEEEFATLGYAVRVPLERVGIVHGLLYLGLRRGVFPLGSEGEEVVDLCRPGGARIGERPLPR